jgi:serine/threonine protein kinase
LISFARSDHNNSFNNPFGVSEDTPKKIKMKTISDFNLEEKKTNKKPNLLKERIRLKKLKEQKKKQPKKILKICDFGLSRSCSVPIKDLSNQVVTLWYRPPDLLLGNTKYNFSCDMWSVGCIFAEMITNRPLFMGKDPEQQLDNIFSIRGSPECNGWSAARHLPNYVRDRWGSMYTQSLGDVLNYNDVKGEVILCIFLRRMLIFRIGVDGEIAQFRSRKEDFSI